MGNSQLPDKRKHKRIPLEVKVQCTIKDSFQEESEATSINISERGVCLKTINPLPTGKEIALKFHLPDSRFILAKGKIVWAKHFTKTYHTIGIRFDMSEEKISVIRNFIENIKI